MLVAVGEGMQAGKGCSKIIQFLIEGAA